MEFLGRGMHQDSPSHHNEAAQLTRYPENTPWHAQNQPAQFGDPRLRPDAGPLYGNPAVPYDQPVVNTRPPASQQMTWAAGGETSAPPSGTAPRPAMTPGLFTVTLVDCIVFSLDIVQWVMEKETLTLCCSFGITSVL